MCCTEYAYLWCCSKELAYLWCKGSAYLSCKTCGVRVQRTCGVRGQLTCGVRGQCTCSGWHQRICGVGGQHTCGVNLCAHQAHLVCASGSSTVAVKKSITFRFRRTIERNQSNIVRTSFKHRFTKHRLYSFVDYIND